MWNLFKKKKTAQDVPLSQNKQPIAPGVKQNFAAVKAVLAENSDIIYRPFQSGAVDCGVIYVEGMIDQQLLEQDVIEPLTQAQGNITLERLFAGVNTGEVKKSEEMGEALKFMLSGDVLLFVGKQAYAIVLGVRKLQSRSVEEPESEVVLRGPRDGFTELIKTNTTLIRRRIHDPRLAFHAMTVGDVSNTMVQVCYMKSIAPQKWVNEVIKRISAIKTDGIMDSGQLEQMIEDNRLSPFPQVLSTERPDRVSKALLEGRVAVLVDGSPFVLLVPAGITAFFQSPEDYYERIVLSSMLRLLRWFGVFLALFLPAFYVAAISFHSGILPTKLLLLSISGRQFVPYQTVVEVILMFIIIELLLEAGTRLPKSIGQIIGIVGGLIIGDAAVKGGLASPFLIVVIAVTTITTFTIPSQSLLIVFRVLRMPIVLMTALFGAIGTMMAFIAICIHLARLTSLNEPYLKPIAPVQPRRWLDTFICAPLPLLQPDIQRPTEGE